MKIDRKQCITQIDAMIKAHRAEFDEAEKAASERFAAEVKAWRTEKSKQLATVLRELAARAAKGGLLTESAIEDAIGTDYSARRSGRDLTWGGDTKPPAGREYREPEKLRRLRTVLAASPDEYVTTSALREFGFSPAIFIKGVN